jgi:lipoate---protein ligase
MTAPLRVLDTGLLPPRRNIAITAAMAEMHAAGQIPDTLRFQHYERSVLLGRNQDLHAAVDFNGCRERGVALARRVTGGGAVYMDAGVLSWEVVADRRRFGGNFEDAAARICGAVAEALSQFGVAGRFSPPNSIVVEDKKISGASGYFEGATLVHEGALLVDVAPEEMSVLRSPEAGPRVTTLQSLLRRAPTVAVLQRAITLSISKHCDFWPAPGPLARGERMLAERLHQSEFGTDAFVFGAEATSPRTSSASKRRSA